MVDMFRLNSGLGTGLRRAFQPHVPIALNHSFSVWLHYTIFQRFRRRRRKQAEQCGLGFELSSVVPNVPKIAEKNYSTDDGWQRKH
jgi:hypothetical protein